MAKVLAVTLGLVCAAMHAQEPPVGSRAAGGGIVVATLFVKTDEGLLVVDTATWKITQSLAWGRGDSASMHGIAVDGARVWVTTGRGSLLEVAKDGMGRWGWGRRIAMPSLDKGSSYPCAVSILGGGTRAAVVLGRNNTLALVDLARGQVTAQVPVAIAPIRLSLRARMERA